MKEMQHLSRLRGNRKLSVLSRKRAMQYWILGFKDEKQLMQEYGICCKLRKRLRLWYWQHYQNPEKFSSKNQKKMQSQENSLKAQIAALEAEKASLEKRLEWSELKNATYEKLPELSPALETTTDKYQVFFAYFTARKDFLAAYGHVFFEFTFRHPEYYFCRSRYFYFDKLYA